MIQKLKLKQASVALAISAFAASSAAHGQLWTAGHGDLGIEYLGNGDFGPEWHLGEDNETVIIDGVSQTLGVAGQGFDTDKLTAQTDRTETRPTGAAWNFTGAADGETLYVFPQTEDPTVPFLGIGTEELDPANWSTDLTYNLTSFSGPGTFSLYTTDPFGAPTMSLTTNGGLFGSLSQAAGTHEHYNWAFTEIGTYKLTFGVSATHDTDGLVTGAETFTFSVVPEPSAFAGIAGLFVLAAVGLRRRRS